MTANPAHSSVLLKPLFIELEQRLLKSQQTPSIAQHQQRTEVMQQRSDHRPCCPEPAERRESNDRQSPAQTDNHVDLQSLTALPTQAHPGAKAPQVATDQHDIR